MSYQVLMREHVVLIELAGVNKQSRGVNKQSEAEEVLINRGVLISRGGVNKQRGC